MVSRSIQSRFGELKGSVKGFIATQQQKLDMSSQPSRQENLNTSGMVKILVIGETGSGKSTFINYLTNYFRKGTLKNLKVAIPSTFHPAVTENFPHHEHDVNDKTQSKTDSCNQYMFTDGTSQYLFVDTPGLSDTRGAEQDKVNLDKIIEAVEFLAGLTAVIIVVNGAIARLTVNLRNVIAQLRGNLPDIVMDNVIVILTNTTRHTANFSLAALELNGNVYPYYMQNSAFSTDPSKWTPTAMQSLQHDWDHAMNELKAMVITLNTFKTKSVAAFKNMKDIRNAIKSLMHAARVEVVQIQKMQDEIAMFEAGLQQANADSVTYKDYTKERIVDKTEVVDAPYHSTLCQNCNHVCHNNCGLDETTAVGAQIFQKCWAIENGNCTQCQHKCTYTAHYHAKKTVKVSKQTLKDVLADIKSRYDAASKNSSEFQNKITNTADAKKLLEKALQQKNAEIIAKCKELRHICSGFNLAAELHALIDQLEVEAAMLRNIDARKQAETFIRSLKQFCETIEQDQDAQQARKNQQSKMTIIDTEQHVEGQASMPYQSMITTDVTNQQNNTSVTNSESSNSGSYASDDVMQQIRALSGGSSKKNEKQKSKQKLQKTVESADDDDNDDEKSEEDNEGESIRMTINTKSTKKKSSHVELPRPKVNTTKPDVEEFKKLSVTELVARHRACEDQRTANIIVNELEQRSHGKSMAPLSDPADIAAFMTSTQKYCLLDNNSLKYTYEKLKEQICSITGPDILEIEKVPSTLLFEIAAVHQLLKNAPASSNPNVINSSFPAQQQPFPYQQQQQPFPYQQQQHSFPYQQQQPLPFYSQQAPYFHQQQYLPPPYQQQKQQMPVNPSPQYPYQPLYNQSHAMGGAPYLPANTQHHMAQTSKSSHLLSDLASGRESVQNVPHEHEHFQQLNAQHHMQAGGSIEQYRQPPIYSDKEHFPRHDMNSPVSQSDQYSNLRPPSSQYQSQYHHPQAYQQHAFRNVSPSFQSSLTSMTPVSSTPLSTSHMSDTFDKMRVSSPFRPIEPNNNYSDINPERSRSSSGFSELSSRANSAIGLPLGSSADELRKYTNTQLLAAYNDPTQKKNRSYEHAIYTELQRRCYGDHPLLISENQTLFQERYNFFQRSSLDELRRFQLEIHEKIRSYLIDDDASNLNSIPEDLIIEAAVLGRLIGTKSLQG